MAQNNNKQLPLVLVTGATGYLAGHVIKQLLDSNRFRVRGTVRSLDDNQKYQHLYKLQHNKQNNLDIVEANLLDQDWNPIVQGCDYIIHVASPCPDYIPNDPDDIIKPAVQGTESIMNSAIQNDIKHVVVTSSVAAICTGQKSKTYLTSQDWSDPSIGPSYERSKHMAEKKAWEIFNDHKKQNPLSQFKFTVICPSVILGPSLSNNQFASGTIIERLMKNKVPGIPKLLFSYVDVREVAQAHVKSLLNPKISNGKRYILTEGSYWLQDLAKILDSEFKRYGYKVPKSKISNFLYKIASKFDKTLELANLYLDNYYIFDNTPSRIELGIFYRNIRQTLIDSAYNCIQRGIIPNLINLSQQQPKL